MFIPVFTTARRWPPILIQINHLHTLLPRSRGIYLNITSPACLRCLLYPPPSSLRISGAVPCFPYTSSWYAERCLYFWKTSTSRVIPDSSVGIATRYGLEGPGIESRWGARFSAPVQTCPGAHPASYTTGTESFPGVKRPRRGVEHLPHLAPRLKRE